MSVPGFIFRKRGQEFRTAHYFRLALCALYYYYSSRPDDGCRTDARLLVSNRFVPQCFLLYRFGRVDYRLARSHSLQRAHTIERSLADPWEELHFARTERHPQHSLYAIVITIRP